MLRSLVFCVSFSDNITFLSLMFFKVLPPSHPSSILFSPFPSFFSSILSLPFLPRPQLLSQNRKLKFMSFLYLQMSIIFPMIYFENQYMEYFLFSSLGGKKNHLQSLQSCFLSVFDPWWIIFPRVYWIHQEKSPIAALLPSVLGCAGFPGTSWHGTVWLVPETCFTRSWYNQHPPPRSLGCLGQNLQREKTFRLWDCEGAWAWVLDKGKRMDFGAFQREGKPPPESATGSSSPVTPPAIN